MIEVYGNKEVLSAFISTLHDGPDDKMFAFIYHEDEIKRRIKGKKKLVLVWELEDITQYLTRKETVCQR